jgi:hypothetical protein
MQHNDHRILHVRIQVTLERGSLSEIPFGDNSNVYPVRINDCIRTRYTVHVVRVLLVSRLFSFSESYGFTLHRLVLPASAIGPKKQDTWRGQSTNDTRAGTHGFGTK